MLKSSKISLYNIYLRKSDEFYGEFVALFSCNTILLKCRSPPKSSLIKEINEGEENGYKTKKKEK